MNLSIFSKTWVLRNPKTNEVRVALKHKTKGFIYVVKFFRPKDDLEAFSVKFFFGNEEQTISHWNTKEEIKIISERKIFLDLAIERLLTFQKILLNLKPEK